MPCSNHSDRAARRRAGLLALFIVLAAGIANICKGTSITEFPASASGSQPYSIIQGPDGGYWFANFGTNNFSSIGHITTNGVATNYFITPFGFSRPYGLAVGPDNNIWFTEAAGNKIGRMNSTNGAMIAEYAVRTNIVGGIVATTPGGMVLGPDGRLWFTEYLGNAISAITVGSGTNVTITEYTNGLPAGCGPYNLAVGPDGNMWFTETVVGKIGTMALDGTVLTNFPLVSTSEPVGIIAGADGALWFTEFSSGLIGRLSTNLVSSSNLTHFSPPTVGSQPYGLVLGKDGAIWFAEYAGSQIGRLAVNGTNASFAEVITPTIGSAPAYLATNADGSIWFTEAAGNRIGRVTDSPLTVTATNIFLTNGLTFSGGLATFLDSDSVPSPTNLYSATINWGDGTTNSGTVVTNTSGGFKVNGTHTYPAAGAYAVKVTVTDLDTTHDMGGATGTASFTINTPPALRIKPAVGGGVVISWPTNATGFQLQANTNLSTTNWMNVTTIPGVNSTNFIVTNNLPGNPYFRLKR
jgi:streptogramin lyase